MDQKKIREDNLSTFIKIKNITIPTDEGCITGDTLLDPTWNLSDHRYGAMPYSFCKSYEEIRKQDILVDGTDKESHKNDQDFINSIKINTIKNKNNKVETLICKGNGLGIKNKISY